ncbi:tetratricopeptide repeat protein [bacterium]|nr:tetratricopeptide repeat protein [bacterium]MBU3954995.1 tetratricopeptide repeat protein [bacterium]
MINKGLLPKIKLSAALFPVFVFAVFHILFLFPKSASSAETEVAQGNNSMFHYLLYSRYFKEGKYLDGLTELEKAREIDKNSIFLMEEILPVYFDMGNYDKVMKTAEQLLKKSDKNFAAFFYMASVYEVRNELDKAANYYRRAAELKQDNADVDFSLGRIYMKKELYDKAEIHFIKAVQNAPDNPLMRFTLAVFYEAEKKWHQAIEQYKVIAELDPSSVNALIKIGEIYSGLGKYADAEKFFLDALAKEPDNFSAIAALAGIYEKQKEWEKLKDVLLKIHIVKDDYPEVEMYLGLAYLNLNDKEKAEEYFKRAVNINPENAPVYYSLALIYMDAKDYTKALDSLDTCEKYGGENTEIDFLKGVCFDLLGNKSIAHEAFEKALVKDPENHRALNYLSYSWAEMEINLPKARSYIDRALKLAPQNSAYLDTSGWVYYKSGSYASAAKLLKKASALEADPVIWEHLGDAYMKLGKKSSAGTAYKKSLDMGGDKAVLDKKIHAAR